MTCDFILSVMRNKLFLIQFPVKIVMEKATLASWGMLYEVAFSPPLRYKYRCKSAAIKINGFLGVFMVSLRILISFVQ